MRGGSGILPACIIGSKVFLLFGKENKFEKDAPGWSDFGGGTDPSDKTFLSTAAREGSEELGGFIGSASEIRRKLRHSYVVDCVATDPKYGTYRTHIFHYPYNDDLCRFYNNHAKFLSAHLDDSVFHKYRIFEKSEIRWIDIETLPTLREQFRFMYRPMLDLIFAQRKDIRRHLMRHSPRQTHRRRRRRHS